MSWKLHSWNCIHISQGPMRFLCLSSANRDGGGQRNGLVCPSVCLGVRSHFWKPLEFGKGLAISYYTLLGLLILIHAGIQSWSLLVPCFVPGGVLLMFCELSKIFSQSLCIAEIMILVRISSWNTESMALGTRTKFQLEILAVNVISGIVYFHKIILESLWNVCETPPGLYPNHVQASMCKPLWCWNQIIMGWADHYRCCWCHGSLHCPDIHNHDLLLCK